jgi:hypothetical protein
MRGHRLPFRSGPKATTPEHDGSYVLHDASTRFGPLLAAAARRCLPHGKRRRAASRCSVTRPPEPVTRFPRGRTEVDPARRLVAASPRSLDPEHRRSPILGPCGPSPSRSLSAALRITTRSRPFPVSRGSRWPGALRERPKPSTLRFRTGVADRRWQPCISTGTPRGSRSSLGRGFPLRSGASIRVSPARLTERTRTVPEAGASIGCIELPRCTLPYEAGNQGAGNPLCGG